MLLQTYRKRQKLSREAVGEALGVNGITIWRWEVGRAVPTTAHILKIREWSAGKVTANDFIGAAVRRGAEVA